MGGNQTTKSIKMYLFGCERRTSFSANLATLNLPTHQSARFLDIYFEKNNNALGTNDILLTHDVDIRNENTVTAKANARLRWMSH